MTSLDLIIAEAGGLEPDGVVVVGLPWDGSSSYIAGAAAAPEAIRRVLLSPAGNLGTETGIDLSSGKRFRTLGDLDLGTDSYPARELEACVEAVVGLGLQPILLGGDHSITAMTTVPFERTEAPLSIVQFDAHPDLYDDFDGDPYSHASPMARILERRNLAKLVQIGIRADTDHQRRQAQKFGVTQIGADRVESLDWATLGLTESVYLSIDLDVLDPAYAPGVAHPEHGGLSTRQLIELIQAVPGRVVGADIVELNPKRDLNDLTAGVGAKMVKEVAARMIGGGDR